MKEQHTRVGIVVSVHNVAPYLAECLESLVGQKHGNFVAFLIDDGSTDESGKICDDYAARDPRLRVAHREGEGVCVARNVALEAIEADGGFDWVTFVDASDRLSPAYLSELVATGNREHADYVLCNTITYPHGSTPEDQTFYVPARYLDRAGIIKHYLRLEGWRHYRSQTRPVSSKLFSEEAICGLRFDPRITAGEDVRFFSQVAPHLSAGVFVNRGLYYNRLLPGRDTLAAEDGEEEEATGEIEGNVVENGRKVDLKLDTVRCFLAQAPRGSALYEDIHDRLVDLLWRRVQRAYATGNRDEILAEKAGLIEEMKQCTGEKNRYRHLKMLLSLPDFVTKCFCMTHGTRH